MLKTEELEKELKQGKLNSIYLLYGPERYLLENSLKKIKNIFGELISGINYIRIDDTNVNSLISDLETPAFGYEKKLIIAKDTGLFKKDGRKKVQANSEIVNKITNYLKENIDVINESTILVFVEQEADKNELFAEVEKLGIVCNFEQQTVQQLVPRIKAIANMYKVRIDDSTANYLIQCSGSSLQDLINEERKLIEYAGEEGTITKQSIDLLCIKKLDSIIFDLTDNLGKKETAKALKVLNDLIYNKEPIQRILVTLYGHFKKLYIVKLCTKNNKNVAENLNLKPTQTFLVSKYKTQSNYFKEDELRQILQELINLDNNYKNGLIDLNVGLEAILCRYC